MPKKRTQASAPTIDMDNPQISRFRKRRCLFSCSPAQAMQRAPRVDSGEVSTRWEPMLIEEIMAITSAPATSLARPGTNGRNIGMTTPEELE